MSRTPDPQRRNLWRDRLKRFAHAQITVSEFCRSEAISVPSFYHWKKKLAISSTNQPERKSLATKENRFVPLVVHAGPTMAKVELPGGATIELPRDLDREQLDDLIGAVICATNHPSDSAEKG